MLLDKRGDEVELVSHIHKLQSYALWQGMEFASCARGKSCALRQEESRTRSA